MYDLMCLGVPLPAVKSGSDDGPDMESFREWVQHHRELENGFKRRRFSRDHDGENMDQKMPAPDK